MLIIQFMGFSIKVLFAMFKGLLRPLLQSETYRAVHRIYKLRGEIYKGVKSYYNPHFFCQSPQQYSIRTHYLMGIGPNTKKIPQNSGKQIRIPEGV